MLSERSTRKDLSHHLLSKEQWHPFPTIDEREPWGGVPDHVRHDLLDAAEGVMSSDWPVITAADYLDFERTGSRRCNKLVWDRRGRLGVLVLAECIEGKGRFLDEIINGIWMVCEESTWCFSCHLAALSRGQGPLPDVSVPALDESAHSTAQLLAWTHYLLGSKLAEVSPTIAKRIAQEVNHRVLEPFRTDDDLHCLGFRPGAKVNNHNPWLHSDVLPSVLLLEDDHDLRVATVERAMRSLDVFISMYDEEGGCEEGPGYWGLAAGRLFASLEFLHSATDGKVDVFGEPLIRNMGRFMCCVHISGEYFVNFADCSARPGTRPELMIRYGTATGDECLRALGLYVATSEAYQRKGARKYRKRPLGECLAMLFAEQELAHAQGPATSYSHLRDAYLGDIEVMTARGEAGADHGLFVSVKGGHNGVSHNHNDVGNFIVYRNGKPMLVDPGVGTYTKQTFSGQRYELWTMQSAYHDLPTIDGHQQTPGATFKAKDVVYEANGDSAQLTMDIADAYPKEADVTSWQRTVRLDRTGEASIVVRDEFQLGHEPESLVLSLMTPCETEVANGEVLLRDDADELSIRFDPDTFQAETEPVSVAGDESLIESWGHDLTRITLKAKNPGPDGVWALRITGRSPS